MPHEGALCTLGCLSRNQNPVYAAESHSGICFFFPSLLQATLSSFEGISMEVPSSHTSSACTRPLPATSGNHPSSSEKELYTKACYKMLHLGSPSVLLWSQTEMISRPETRPARSQAGES